MFALSWLPRETADGAILGHADAQCGGPGQDLAAEGPSLRGCGRPQGDVHGGWTGTGTSYIGGCG